MCKERQDNDLRTKRFVFGVVAKRDKRTEDDEFETNGIVKRL